MTVEFTNVLDHGATDGSISDASTKMARRSDARNLNSLSAQDKDGDSDLALLLLLGFIRFAIVIAG